MNILFYIPNLNHDWGGVRNYAITLINMFQRDFDNHYYIYYDFEDTEIITVIGNIPNHTLITSIQINASETVTVKVPLRLFSRIPGLKRFKVGKKISIDGNLSGYCEKQNIQIIHCPYQFIPKTKNIKLITTMHDVQEIHFPEYFSAEARAYRATNYLDFLRRANIVIVSYDHVKDDLIRYFNVNSCKIEVLHLDMEKLWFERFHGKDVTDISFLGIPQTFLLYPANTWKHKNHLTLLKAIANAKARNNIIINLVCTGHQNEHFFEIEQLINDLKLGDQVFFTGIVEEKVLYTLYKTCRGVVIPTTYEAGSFPLYESILLNIPVVCSNVTSLPDTIKCEEFLFDPFNIDSMADAIIRLWEDDIFLKKNLEHCNRQATILRNNNSLPKLISLYSKLNEN